MRGNRWRNLRPRLTQHKRPPAPYAASQLRHLQRPSLATQPRLRVAASVHAPFNLSSSSSSSDSSPSPEHGKAPHLRLQNHASSRPAGRQPILTDAQHRLLLRFASSGILGSGWSAPPCKEFSRLKRRQPGSKALRAPDFMDGAPMLSKGQRHRVDASTRDSRKVRQILFKELGGQTGVEQPPSSMAWLQPLPTYGNTPARNGRF